MTLTEIEANVRALVDTFDEDTFIYKLLEAYGKPKASVKRLSIVGKGSYNLSKNPGEILWKKQLLFKISDSNHLHSEIDAIKKSDDVQKNQPRFLIVTDKVKLLAIDTRTTDTLNTNINELHKKFDFFLPWAGLEKSQAQSENPADVKAAEKMAKLFDLLRENNPADSQESIHAQNVFLSRILFCYFAEDTGIFTSKLFSRSISSHTKEDGSDLSEYIQKVFAVMNQEVRRGLPEYLNEFPYVNGGLFADSLPVPAFNRKSRAMLIECGVDLNWSEINPDIFGSMIQAVVDPEQRGSLGVHYTSVPNIMKVIEPLFLNDLKEDFEKNSQNKNKLEQLLLRLEHVRIFDPACGSGNFLIIAYKEIRKLEMKIFTNLQEISKGGLLPLSRIKLSQFYGIELDDFAHEVAILSLWLAEHQMNMRFKETFGYCSPALPLSSSGNIVHSNSNTIPWSDVCPPAENIEIFVLGNPPYRGSSLQTEQQKSDMLRVLGHVQNYKKLDYIAAWFFNAAKFIVNNKAKSAFVSTNSICQGEQVSILWPTIFQLGIEIGIAHQSFKWRNNARNNAGVTCVIIGLQNICNEEKYIFDSDSRRSANNINAYLIDFKNIFIQNRRSPIASISPMSYGSKPADGGHLILSVEQKNEIVHQFPEATKFIKRFIGTDEFLYSTERYCLWIADSEVDEARHIPPIHDRLIGVRDMRLESTKAATRELANFPNRFGEIRYVDGEPSILVPGHSSENRRCVPMGFLDGNSVVSNSAYLVLNATAFDLGILQSTMHTAWIKTVGGSLETRIRYSSSLCYNNFPFPLVSQSQRQRVSKCALEILAQRELYSELTLDELYEPEDMPLELISAHDALDVAVDNCYRSKPFESMNERIIFLFKLYEKMTGTQNA